MATRRQIRAFRKNAKHSTGPRTPEGKARSSQNARKHGLFARDTVLPEENPEEFIQLIADLEQELEAGGAFERRLVRHIADAEWRMRRLVRLETGALMDRLEKERLYAQRVQAELGKVNQQAGHGEENAPRPADPYRQSTLELGAKTKMNKTVFVVFRRGETVNGNSYLPDVFACVRTTFVKAAEAARDRKPAAILEVATTVGADPQVVNPVGTVMNALSPPYDPAPGVCPCGAVFDERQDFGNCVTSATPISARAVRRPTGAAMRIARTPTAVPARICGSRPMGPVAAWIASTTITPSSTGGFGKRLLATGTRTR